MSESITICGGCRQVIDPAVPGIEYAVELVPAPAFGGNENQEVEGGEYFHSGCFPIVGYRRKTKP